MAVTIETLNGLERRFNLSIPADLIEKEVTTRLQRLSRTVRVPGFRDIETSESSMPDGRCTSLRISVFAHCAIGIVSARVRVTTGASSLKIAAQSGSSLRRVAPTCW